MSSGIESGFKPRNGKRVEKKFESSPEKKVEKKEEDPKEKAKKHITDIKNSLLSAFSKLSKEEKLDPELAIQLLNHSLSFFRNAEKGGPASAVVRSLPTKEEFKDKYPPIENLPTKEEVEAERNLEIISAIGRFFEGKYPPVNKELQAKKDLEKIKIVEAMKKGRSIFEAERSAASFERKKAGRGI